MSFQAGEEVTARSVLLILEAASLQGVAADRLLADTGLDPASLSIRAARVPWPAFCIFLANARGALGEEGLLEAGRSLPTTPAGRVLALTATLVSDPVDLYRLICRPNSGLIEVAFACVRVTLRQPAPDQLEIEMHYTEDYTPPPGLHACWRGIFEGLPQFVGFPSASVSVELLPEGARFAVSFPFRSDSWSGRLRRWLRQIRTRRVPREQVVWALLELEARSEQLARAIENLEQDRLSRISLEDRFAKAFHASPTVISLVRESDHLLIDVNQSFLNLIGARRGDVIGLNAGKAPWHTPAEIERIELEGDKNPHFRDFGYSLRARTARFATPGCPESPS